MTPTIDLSRTEIRSLATFVRILLERHGSIRGIVRANKAKGLHLPAHTLGDILDSATATLRVKPAHLEAIAKAIGPELTVEVLLRRPGPVPAAPTTPLRTKRGIVRRATVRR